MRIILVSLSFYFSVFSVLSQNQDAWFADSLIGNSTFSSLMSKNAVSLTTKIVEDFIGKGKFEVNIGLNDGKTILEEQVETILSNLGNFSFKYKYPIYIYPRIKNKNSKCGSFNFKSSIGTNVAITPKIINQDSTIFGNNFYMSFDAFFKSKNNDLIIIHPIFSLNLLNGNKAFVENFPNKRSTIFYLQNSFYLIVKKTYVIGLNFPILLFGNKKPFTPYDLKFSYNFK